MATPVCPICKSATLVANPNGKWVCTSCGKTFASRKAGGGAQGGGAQVGGGAQIGGVMPPAGIPPIPPGPIWQSPPGMGQAAMGPVPPWGSPERPAGPEPSGRAEWSAGAEPTGGPAAGGVRWSTVAAVGVLGLLMLGTLGVLVWLVFLSQPTRPAGGEQLAKQPAIPNDPLVPDQQGPTDTPPAVRPQEPAPNWQAPAPGQNNGGQHAPPATGDRQEGREPEAPPIPPPPVQGQQDRSQKPVAPRDQREPPAGNRAVPDQNAPDLAALFEKLAPSVPQVVTLGRGSGSGFLIEHAGRLYVITNKHVVRGGKKGFQLNFHNAKGELVLRVSSPDVVLTHVSRDADVAALDCTGIREKLQTANIKPVKVAPKGSLPAVGASVFAIGHPGVGDQILRLTLTSGIVSAVGREILRQKCIQTTVAINPGNSGGPLFDTSGTVVGINTMSARGKEALHFALETSHLHELLEVPSARMNDQEKDQFLATLADDEDEADVPDSIKAFPTRLRRVVTLKPNGGKENLRFQLSPDAGIRIYSTGIFRGPEIAYVVCLVKQKTDKLIKARVVFVTTKSTVASVDCHADMRPVPIMEVRCDPRTERAGARVLQYHYVIELTNPNSEEVQVGVVVIVK